MHQLKKQVAELSSMMPLRKSMYREFPGSPMVRTQGFHCHGPGSIPGQGTKIPQATQPTPKKERETSSYGLLLLLLNGLF